MKIYVASSWRNELQPEVVSRLRLDGHTVYDFRHPAPDNHGFHWSDIDQNWKLWSVEKYRDSLEHPLAEDGFDFDMVALRDSEAVVAVQPFGRSTSMELGWAAGYGKWTILLLDNGEPELMVKMCDYICVSLEEVRNILDLIMTVKENDL